MEESVVSWKLYNDDEWRETEIQNPSETDNPKLNRYTISDDQSQDLSKHLDDDFVEQKRRLNDYLLSSLKMKNLIVLAGSGTSLGVIGAPSMSDLWNLCVCDGLDEKNEGNAEEISEKARSVIEWVGYRRTKGDTVVKGKNIDNIEELLSRIESYLQLNDIKSADGAEEVRQVQDFYNESKTRILKKCNFVKQQTELHSHELFLRKISSRQRNAPRVKIFTTNYDKCFEVAAGRLGQVVIDGFSFSQPRIFDPRFFEYDIIREEDGKSDTLMRVSGVLKLYKIHGSVDWKRANGVVTNSTSITSKNVCMIFPVKGKYQQSYIQPHLEMMAQYFASLREPETCVIVVGFGLNDDHLSEPLLGAIRANPRLRIIFIAPDLKDIDEGKKRMLVHTGRKCSMNKIAV